VPRVLARSTVGYVQLAGQRPPERASTPAALGRFHAQDQRYSNRDFALPLLVKDDQYACTNEVTRARAVLYGMNAIRVISPTVRIRFGSLI
jgi:hypothetical protein